MIIVLGTGRCGTSTIARLLHNNLKINMGKRFREPNKSNPKGFFEDLDFRDLNHQVLNNMIDNSYFQRSIDKLVKSRKGQWGIKDPRICNLWENYQRFLAQYIVCSRRPKMVIRSLITTYGWSESNSRQFLMHRLLGIDQLLEDRDALRIDFTAKRDETQLINLLKRFLQ